MARKTWPWIWKWNVTSVWPLVTAEGVDSKVGPNTVAILFRSILFFGSEATCLKWLKSACSEPWFAFGNRSKRLNLDLVLV